MAQRSQYVVGIDPGLKVIGYGVVRVRDGEVALAEGGVLESDAVAPLEQRLRQLYTQLREVLRSFPPDTVVVEDLYSQYAYPRTAILMGHARGIVYLAAAEAGAQVVAYAPTLVKRSLTGNGRAPKEQVARMVAQILHLVEPPRPKDVTDALALALCHCAPPRLRTPLQTRRRPRELPAALRDLWPT